MKQVIKVVMVLTLASLVGLGLTVTADAKGKRGGTLVIPYSATPRHFNPAVQSGIATMLPGAQLFATPLRFDENWNPQPYLAKSWKISADGLSVTLKLEENATFHDGNPVTSEDVAFSIKTIKEPKN